MKSITPRSFVVGLVITLLTGCQQSNIKPDTTCVVPSTQNLAQAFEQVMAAMDNRQCQLSFSEYEARLLSIAEGDSAHTNNQYFFDYYKKAATLGVISKEQARANYSQRFKPTFDSALPDNASICALSGRVDEITEQLDTELRLKEQGIARINGDKEAWFSVQRHHQQLVTLLKASAMACTDQLL
ncbi:MAG: hypothetical protein OIF57_10780 [Marinobacterium sp.]|nr:hypothetical protein [Marinobacterium sp.]